MNNSQRCGTPGAEAFGSTASCEPQVFADEVQGVLDRRHLGNESFSLWANVTLKASGAFKLCWCQGARPEGVRLSCERGEENRLEKMKIHRSIRMN